MNTSVDQQNVVLITGASRGIGAGILSEFCNDDYFVIGTATSDTGLEKISKTLNEKNAQGIALKLNLSSTESIDQFISALAETKLVVDVLVNNAGQTDDNLALRMKPEQWSNIINTNLTGTFLLTQKLLKPMIKKRLGRIINISSVVASMGNPGQCNYSAAKAGLEAMSKSLAKEVASRNITINSIAPGFIDTDMTRQLSDHDRENMHSNIPAGFIGDVSDIAAAVSFLASQGARYITGQTLHVNGGMYM